MVNDMANYPLTVYKANAGTGKTFTLACEYMKLVITNPQSFRNILAVTFTNKATEEMKVRILSKLHGIANDYPDAKPYKDKIIKETGLGEAIVRKNAGIALSNLLHNYNYFRVQTIDTFFQSVLRNLAKELDLTANLRVELNDKEIEQQAVDEMIEGLNPGNDTLKLIINFINDNISDDKGWNVIGKIKEFGENIFKDFYKQNREQLSSIISDSAAIDSYIKELHALKTQSEKGLKALSDRFFDALRQTGYDVSDFSKGSRGVCGYFIKLKNSKYSEEDLLNKTVEKARTDESAWLVKADQKPGNPKYELVVNTLIPLLNDCELKRPELYKNYKSADLTLRHMYQLRLLSGIDDKVHEINKDVNRFLLSDTQALLNDMVRDSDAPFIFEKIGSHLEHIMIDEFQDTSRVQWYNFKKLLLECMSYRNAENLIVGDVKQSIYRWRDGDWTLLNDIEKQFPDAPHQLEIKSLKKNYRSNRNIIDFNNAFFEKASDIEYEELLSGGCAEAEQLKKAYSGIAKEPKDGRANNGLIKINTYKDDDGVLENLLEDIRELHWKGVAYGKMAILVRSSRNLSKIADYFLHTAPDIPLVSNEAFKLKSSSAVLTLISALKYIVNPANKLEKTYLESKNAPDAFFLNIEKLSAMPLYDLIETLCYVLGLSGQYKEGAYLCAFLDQVKKYLQDNTPDISAFLQAWEDGICDKTIQSGDVDGISLVTIHKSKGLEYDNVFVPFCDWIMEQKSIIWCDTIGKPSPFSKLPLVPIDYSPKQLKGTVYEEDYQKEHLQNVVDNLNLLYVAFTRASKNLFVSGKTARANSRSSVIERALSQVADSLEGCSMSIEGEHDGEITFSYGTLDISEDEEKVQVNVFEQKPDPIENASIANYDNNISVRQRNESRQFVEDNGDDEDRGHFIKRGNILHSIFSNIRTTDDIEPAIRQLEFEGVIYDDEITPDELRRMLQRGLRNPMVKDWFSPKWHVFNECPIIFYDEVKGMSDFCRPDRVMTDGKRTIVVDFKFGSKRDSYQTQVANYMNLLRDMGYDNVSGYIWYVLSNVIEEVRL